MEKKFEKAYQKQEIGNQEEAESKRKEDVVLAEVVGGILEDILHNQTDKLERHFDLILRTYPDAFGIAEAGERIADRSSYFEVLRKVPLALLSRLYLAGWLEEKNVDNYQNIVNRLTKEINERIGGIGGVRLVEEINVEEFLKNLKNNEQSTKS